MEIPRPDTPLARWRINLRERLSYTILVTCPDIMSYNVNKDWMDMQCIEKLESFQTAHHLSEGTIPADVFAVATIHFTARALDEGQKASQSTEEGEHHVSQTHENVEPWGLRPRLLSPKLVRMKKVLLLTDSGAPIYRRKKNTSVKPDNYFNNDGCAHPWKNITTSCECGAGWVKWAASLNTFVAEYGGIMERCPDGKKRFPSHVTVIVIDNLNGSGADNAVNEEKKSEEKRTSMRKFLNNVETQAAITELMELIDCFKSAVYCQIAPAKHWGMTAEVDKIADYVRQKARAKNIATLDATQSWLSIKGFMGPGSLDSKPGENAGKAEGDKNVIHWRHYETGETKALPFHWDRYLFRLVRYLETRIIHESVKSKIFDMNEIKRLSDNTKSEALAYRLVLEDQKGASPMRLHKASFRHRRRIAMLHLPLREEDRRTLSMLSKAKTPMIASLRVLHRREAITLVRAILRRLRLTQEMLPPSSTRRLRMVRSPKRKMPQQKKLPKGLRRSCTSSPTCTARMTRRCSRRMRSFTFFHPGQLARIPPSASSVS